MRVTLCTGLGGTREVISSGGLVQARSVPVPTVSAAPTMVGLQMQLGQVAGLPGLAMTNIVLAGRRGAQRRRPQGVGQVAGAGAYGAMFPK